LDERMNEVLVTIRELAEGGMTCVIVTHEIGVARRKVICRISHWRR
jgi:ABC-type polar amino acid transport system ATPase subunit